MLSAGFQCMKLNLVDVLFYLHLIFVLFLNSNLPPESVV